MADERYASISMSDDEFRLIRDQVYQFCGIYLPQSVKFLMERRLRPRLPVYNLESFRDYYRLIRYGRQRKEEMDEVIDRITVNETYFFRGESQLKAFSEEVIPDVFQRRRRGETIKIWSAGCSSGEEPYTLAMLLNEMPQTAAYQFEIVGHDISRKVLQVAEEGLYRSASFRQTPKELRKKYFDTVGAQYKLRQSIAQKVRFGHLNLIDSNAMLGIRDIDVVLCRNVMIYFSPESRKTLLDNLLVRMRPGGVLILGHSESLINVSTGFQIEPLKNDIVYRKPQD